MFLGFWDRFELYAIIVKKKLASARFSEQFRAFFGNFKKKS
jgi:hypothetical protein